MTIANVSPEVTITSGSQVDFGFEIFSADDLIAEVIDADGNETLLVLNTNYSVTLTYPNIPKSTGVINLIGTGAWLDASGNLVSGYTFRAVRNTPLTQTSPFNNLGQFFPQTLESALDKVTMALQESKKNGGDGGGVSNQVLEDIQILMTQVADLQNGRLLLDLSNISQAGRDFIISLGGDGGSITAEDLVTLLQSFTDTQDLAVRTSLDVYSKAESDSLVGGLVDGSVTTPKLADNAVTVPKLAQTAFLIRGSNVVLTLGGADLVSIPLSDLNLDFDATQATLGLDGTELQLSDNAGNSAEVELDSIAVNHVDREKLDNILVDEGKFLTAGQFTGTQDYGTIGDPPRLTKELLFTNSSAERDMTFNNSDVLPPTGENTRTHMGVKGTPLAFPTSSTGTHKKVIAQMLIIELTRRRQICTYAESSEHRIRAFFKVRTIVPRREFLQYSVCGALTEAETTTGDTLSEQIETVTFLDGAEIERSGWYPNGRGRVVQYVLNEEGDAYVLNTNADSSTVNLDFQAEIELSAHFPARRQLDTIIEGNLGTKEDGIIESNQGYAYPGTTPGLSAGSLVGDPTVTLWQVVNGLRKEQREDEEEHGNHRLRLTALQRGILGSSYRDKIPSSDETGFNIRSIPKEAFESKVQDTLRKVDSLREAFPLITYLNPTGREAIESGHYPKPVFGDSGILGFIGNIYATRELNDVEEIIIRQLGASTGGEVFFRSEDKGVLIFRQGKEVTGRRIFIELWLNSSGIDQNDIPGFSYIDLIKRGETSTIRFPQTSVITSNISLINAEGDSPETAALYRFHGSGDPLTLDDVMKGFSSISFNINDMHVDSEIVTPVIKAPVGTRIEQLGLDNDRQVTTWLNNGEGWLDIGRTDEVDTGSSIEIGRVSPKLAGDFSSTLSQAAWDALSDDRYNDLGYTALFLRTTNQDISDSQGVPGIQAHGTSSAVVLARVLNGCGFLDQSNCYVKNISLGAALTPSVPACGENTTSFNSGSVGRALSIIFRDSESHVRQFDFFPPEGRADSSILTMAELTTPDDPMKWLSYFKEVVEGERYNVLPTEAPGRRELVRDVGSLYLQTNLEETNLVGIWENKISGWFLLDTIDSVIKKDISQDRAGDVRGRLESDQSITSNLHPSIAGGGVDLGAVSGENADDYIGVVTSVDIGIITEHRTDFTLDIGDDEVFVTNAPKVLLGFAAAVRGSVVAAFKSDNTAYLYETGPISRNINNHPDTFTTSIGGSRQFWEKESGSGVRRTTLNLLSSNGVDGSPWYRVTYHLVAGNNIKHGDKINSSDTIVEGTRDPKITLRKHDVMVTAWDARENTSWKLQGEREPLRIINQLSNGNTRNVWESETLDVPAIRGIHEFTGLVDSEFTPIDIYHEQTEERVVTGVYRDEFYLHGYHVGGAPIDELREQGTNVVRGTFLRPANDTTTVRKDLKIFNIGTRRIAATILYRRAVGQQQTAKLQFGEIAASGISFTPPVNSTTTLTHWVDNEVYGNNTDGVVGLSHVTYDGVPWVLAIVLQTTLDDSAHNYVVYTQLMEYTSQPQAKQQNVNESATKLSDIVIQAIGPMKHVSGEDFLLPILHIVNGVSVVSFAKVTITGAGDAREFVLSDLSDPENLIRSTSFTTPAPHNGYFWCLDHQFGVDNTTLRFGISYFITDFGTEEGRKGSYYKYGNDSLESRQAALEERVNDGGVKKLASLSALPSSFTFATEDNTTSIDIPASGFIGVSVVVENAAHTGDVLLFSVEELRIKATSDYGGTPNATISTVMLRSGTTTDDAEIISLGRTSDNKLLLSIASTTQAVTGYDVIIYSVSLGGVAPGGGVSRTDSQVQTLARGQIRDFAQVATSAADVQSGLRTAFGSVVLTETEYQQLVTDGTVVAGRIYLRTGTV